MGKIEDILKLDRELSRQIEEAKAQAREIIALAQKEADSIVESSYKEVAAYRREREEALKQQIEKLRERYLKEFERKKEKIMQKFLSCKDELKDYIIKKILGYDS